VDEDEIQQRTAEWNLFMQRYDIRGCIQKFPRMRELVTFGIPPSLRPSFWMLYSGAVFDRPPADYYKTLLSKNKVLFYETYLFFFFLLILFL